MAVAVVTGGSRGIGAKAAVALAEQGFEVAVVYRRQREAADEVVATCRRSAKDAAAFQADVSSEAAVEELFAEIDERLGILSVLVNNAGIVAPRARLDEMAGPRLVGMMAVNVIGPMLCAREAVRRMSTAHGGTGGSIINVSSAASRLGSPAEYVDYAASKGAIDTFTIGLAREVADEGIRVNAVRPGLIETDIHASGGQPDRVARMAPTIPMKRAGLVSEVADVIVWLCSDRASYVTGALIDVSGGR